MLDRSSLHPLVRAVRRERRQNRRALAPSLSGDPAKAPPYADSALLDLCRHVRSGIDRLAAEAGTAPALRRN
jgi:hypothetical protein